MTSRHRGRWRIERAILDTSTASVIVCTGDAEIAGSAAELRYDESVAFEVDSRSIRASRAYFYVQRGAVISASFADRRPFFDSTLQPDGTATAIHHCGPDLYAGTFTLGDDDRWETCWDVTGTKSLRIHTRYHRVLSAPADAPNHSSEQRSLCTP